MRNWTTFVGFAVLNAAAWAGGDALLGTKPDLVKNPAKYDSGPGLMPLFQTILVLGVVLFVLKTAAPKVIAKLGKKISTNANGLIKVEESATFAGGSLYVVEARGKTLLLSVGSQGVSCLADLTTEKPVDPTPLFMDLVAEAETRRGDDENPPQAAIYLDEPADQSPVGIGSLLRNEEIETLRRSAQRTN